MHQLVLLEIDRLGSAPAGGGRGRGGGGTRNAGRLGDAFRATDAPGSIWEVGARSTEASTTRDSYRKLDGWPVKDNKNKYHTR